MAGTYRYSIGIDLGTSNCALAYVDLQDPSAQVSILEIPQWETLSRSISKKTLASCIYFPTKAEQQQAKIAGWTHRHIVGEFGRNQLDEYPSLVIHSAKSWLCHTGVDRTSKILPWMSQEVSNEYKLSAVEASALLLDYMRIAWNQSIGSRDPSVVFEKQHIVITVPASFDQDSQKLTLLAASKAGYPSHTRLLEEPQAAFYSWIDLQEKHEGLTSAVKQLGIADAMTILICDIGGGTTDLSLFTLSISSETEDIDIKRIAVSDHILLGGDNIDCALAKRCEEKIFGPSGQLPLFLWQQLVSQCRKLKEKFLSQKESFSGVNDDEHYYVAIAGNKSDLFAQTYSTSLSQKELLEIIAIGFFPECKKDDVPFRDVGGFKELGLPFAQDCAVTRHVAGFCRTTPLINAVLFNGGALSPLYLQKRIRDTIAMWQNGVVPIHLENKELDLSVAKGASLFGKMLVLQKGQTITGGISRGYYLKLHAQQKQETEYLLCVVPQGTPWESVQRISALDLKVRVNEPVEFRLFYSSKRRTDPAGQLIKYIPSEFSELPPLQTFMKYEAKKEGLHSQQLSIAIEARVNSVGLIQIVLFGSESKQSQKHTWELEFNLRKSIQRDVEADASTTTNNPIHPLSRDIFETISNLIHSPFSSSLLKDIESIVQKKKTSWNKTWLRQMWEPLSKHLNERSISENYETTWLNAAGYFLRPGFGVALDEQRISKLFAISALGLSYPHSKAVREQYYVLWRRVAAGLDSLQQTTLFEEIRFLLQSHVKQAAEAVRMASSFERLQLKHKKELFHILLEGISLYKDKHCDHYLWSLGRLLSRIPCYSNEDAVMPPHFVAECFFHLKDYDWTKENLVSVPALFSFACRKTKQRALDISEELRAAVILKMQDSHAKEKYIRVVKEYVKLEIDDFAHLFGESLPLGIVLGSFS